MRLRCLESRDQGKELRARLSEGQGRWLTWLSSGTVGGEILSELACDGNRWWVSPP